MKNISEELMLILNLRNTALDHKSACGHNCNVSLGQLKQAAIYISRAIALKGYSAEEQIEAIRYIDEMPIT